MIVDHNSELPRNHPIQSKEWSRAGLPWHFSTPVSAAFPRKVGTCKRLRGPNAILVPPTRSLCRTGTGRRAQKSRKRAEGSVIWSLPSSSYCVQEQFAWLYIAPADDISTRLQDIEIKQKISLIQDQTAYTTASASQDTAAKQKHYDLV